VATRGKRNLDKRDKKFRGEEGNRLNLNALTERWGGQRGGRAKKPLLKVGNASNKYKELEDLTTLRKGHAPTCESRKGPRDGVGRSRGGGLGGEDSVDSAAKGGGSRRSSQGCGGVEGDTSGRIDSAVNNKIDDEGGGGGGGGGGAGGGGGRVERREQ